MNEGQIDQDRLDQFIESVYAFTDKVSLTVSNTDERIKEIEKLISKIEQKLTTQDKLIENLSSYILGDKREWK